MRWRGEVCSPPRSGKKKTLAKAGVVRDTAFGRSRPAADASREAVQRWLFDGLDVNVGHRRCSRDPSSQTDAGRTPAS